jgi:hypothetical protein
MACLHHIFQKASEWDLVARNTPGRGESLLTKENNKRLRFLTLLSDLKRAQGPGAKDVFTFTVTGSYVAATDVCGLRFAW